MKSELIDAVTMTQEVEASSTLISQPTALIYDSLSPSSWSWSTTSSFTYGLLVGQFSVLIVMVLFIRFFIFADQPSSSSRSSKDYSTHIQNRRQAKVLPANSAGVNTILEKTYYNVETHEPESLNWFTVLIAQVVSRIRDDAKVNDNILKSLDSALNGDNIPDFVDTIKVTEVNIGDDYPIFSNCKILQSRVDDGDSIKGEDDEEGVLEAQFDVDLSDTLTLGIETRLLLNYPRSLFAYLPVSLGVSIVRFSGTLTVSLRKFKSSSEPVPEQSNGIEDPSVQQPGKTYLTFSFAPDYRLEFNVKSLVGARSRLQDVPKIGQLVESRLRKWFADRCVSPRYQQIPLPSFWPRSKTTKEHHKSHSSNSSSASHQQQQPQQAAPQSSQQQGHPQSPTLQHQQQVLNSSSIPLSPQLQSMQTPRRSFSSSSHIGALIDESREANRSSVIHAQEEGGDLRKRILQSTILQNGK